MGTDLRKKTWFHCAIDGEPMMLTQGKYSFYYCCPRHFQQNRELGEKSCKNCLSIRDADMVFARLEWMEEDGALNPGAEVELPGVRMKVLHTEADEVRVSILNTKILKHK